VDVYDRWGQVVHRSVGYAEPWNGKNRRGRDLPTGTYYFVIDLNDPDVELPLVKGYVAILR
jgi:gliding motility-associated-like protein